MTTVIVPIDFSQTSLNAAHYTAGLYRNNPSVHVIFYHFTDNDKEHDTAKNYLESLRAELSASLPNSESCVEGGKNFIEALGKFAHAKRAFLVIMGLTGKTPMSQRFSGSNTLKMAEQNVCPVLIVPEDARYEQLDNVLITSEMKFIEETPVIITVKKVLDHFRPSVHVLNVDESHYISLTPEYKEQRDKMEELLNGYNPEFYFMRLYDFHESVNLFAADKNIDMIITGPKYHSFFDKMFRTQHTRKMIYQSKVPVLAVHE